MGARESRGLIRLPRPRPASGAFFSWLVVSATLGALPAPGGGQEPPDTTGVDTAAAPVRDTIGAPQDTVPADTTARDTTPPPRLPRFPHPEGTGWHRSVWTWERADLLRQGAVTLLGLLERVPGLEAIRSGVFSQPEVLSAPRGMPGRVEIYLDGFALDNLRTPGYDLSDIELVQLERVRVERWGDRVRIHLESVTPTRPQAETLIEAATGEQGVNLFRGSVRVPRILGGPLAAAFERLDTDGIAPTGTANRSTLWGKWSLVSGSSGLQIELRNTEIQRTGPEGAGVIERSDWVTRARTRLPMGVLGDAYLGASTVRDSVVPGSQGDAALTRRSGLQAGVRATLDTGAVHVGGAVRFRTLEGLPGTTAEADADLSLPWLRLGGFARWEDWGGAAATSWGGRAALGPVLGFEPFIQATGGEVGIPFQPEARLHASGSLRVGASFRRWGLGLGASLLRVDADSVPGLGLPFEGAAGPFPGLDNDLLEVSVRLPTGFEPVWLEGTYTRALDAVAAPYRADEAWRGGVVYHHLPLESGNLEFFARLEHWRRGSMLVPGEGGLVTVPRIGQYDFYLHIRVITVRAFLRWENFTLRRENYDLPGHLFPVQRIYYGVKWTFFR